MQTLALVLSSVLDTDIHKSYNNSQLVKKTNKKKHFMRQINSKLRLLDRSAESRYNRDLH